MDFATVSNLPLRTPFAFRPSSNSSIVKRPWAPWTPCHGRDGRCAMYAGRMKVWGIQLHNSLVCDNHAINWASRWYLAVWVWWCDYTSNNCDHSAKHGMLWHARDPTPQSQPRQSGIFSLRDCLLPAGCLNDLMYTMFMMMSPLESLCKVP